MYQSRKSSVYVELTLDKRGQLPIHPIDDISLRAVVRDYERRAHRRQGTPWITKTDA